MMPDPIGRVFFAVIALAVLAIWWWRRLHRRPPVPSDPVIHRSVLEEAEREVQSMPLTERPPMDGDDEWGPGTPRSPLRL